MSSAQSYTFEFQLRVCGCPVMQCVAMAVLSVLAVFEIIVAVIAELLRTDEVRAEPQTHALARLLLLLLWGRRRN